MIYIYEKGKYKRDHVTDYTKIPESIILGYISEIYYNNCLEVV